MRGHNIKETRKTRGGGGPISAGLITGCIFLFTGRWAYNWGAYKRGGGGLKSGSLRYNSCKQKSYCLNCPQQNTGGRYPCHELANHPVTSTVNKCDRNWNEVPAMRASLLSLLAKFTKGIVYSDNLQNGNSCK